MTECLQKNHDKICENIQNSGEFLDEVIEVSEIFALLGEPKRMQIILALAKGELCVYHLCAITGGKQSAISQHLRKLKDKKIVKCRKEANQVLYSLSDKHIVEIINNALSHKNCKND